MPVMLWMCSTQLGRKRTDWAVDTVADQTRGAPGAPQWLAGRSEWAPWAFELRGSLFAINRSRSCASAEEHGRFCVSGFVLIFLSLHSSLFAAFWPSHPPWYGEGTRGGSLCGQRERVAGSGCQVLAVGRRGIWWPARAACDYLVFARPYLPWYSAYGLGWAIK